MGRVKRRWLVLVGVVALLMAGTVTGGAVAAPRNPPPPKLLTDLLGLLFPPKKAPPPKAPSAPAGFTAADAKVDRVPLFDSPGVASGGRTLSNPTREGLSLVFLVKQDRGEWLHVQIPSRPNGATAWIRRSDVVLRSVPNRIQIEREGRRLTVFNGTRPIGQFKVAVGSPETPTPTGDFYVDGVVHLAKTTGPFGVGQVSVTGFSDVHQSFGGGNGQIAIHGTNKPELIGGTVSNGCIRMLNADWTRLAELAPSGTPVSIVA